jgi:hypothetical protein
MGHLGYTDYGGPRRITLGSIDGPGNLRNATEMKNISWRRVDLDRGPGKQHDSCRWRTP